MDGGILDQIRGLAVAIRKRSSSPTIDGWTLDLEALCDELAALPPEYVERRGADRRIEGVDDPMRPGRRAGQRRGAVRQYPVIDTVGSVFIDTPPDTALEVSETVQLTASVWGASRPDDDGNMYQPELTGARTVVWSTNAGSVATVSGTGLVTAVGAGSATITATCNGVANSIGITVTASAPVVAAVVVTPATVAGVAGETVVISAQPQDSGGFLVPGQTVTWGTNNGAVATVGADSGTDAHQVTVTFVAAGTATITATCGVQTDTCVVTVSAVPSGTLRTFTTPEWAFLLGPQTVPGTYDAPGVPNLESSLTARIDEFVTRLTSIPGFVAAAGTISLSVGSSTCTGVGTAFTGKTGYGIRWPDAAMPRGYGYAKIVSVASDTVCTIGGYSAGSGADVAVNYSGAPISGVAFALSNNSALDGSGNRVDDFNSLYNYYDTVLALYQAWAKVDNMAGGSTILTKARTIADALADTRSLGGFNINSPTSFQGTPRGLGLVGHMCRAYDGGFDDCLRKMDKHVDSVAYWLDREKIGGSNQDQNYIYSVRDGAYVLMFAAILGVIHPDAARKTYFRDKAIAWCLDPFLRKYDTGALGGLRWWNRKADAATFSEADGVTAADYHQPFLHSLAHEAFIWVHRMMRYHNMEADPNYTTIGNAIVSAADGWWSCYQWTGNGQPANLRAVAYFSGLEGQKAWGTTPLVAVTPPGAPFGLNLSGTSWDAIVSARQQNADGLANIAYAYALTSDATYRSRCLEALASCFEFQAVNSTIYSSLWYAPQTEKNWNQHHRTGQKLTGWLQGGLDPL